MRVSFTPGQFGFWAAGAFFYASAILGNYLIQFKLLRLDVFYWFVGANLLAAAYRILHAGGRVELGRDSSPFFYPFLALFALGAVYIVLSFAGFFHRLAPNVQFSRSYVLRQGYILLFIPIGCFWITSLREDMTNLAQLFFSPVLIYILWGIAYIAYLLRYVDNIPMRAVSFALISCLGLRAETDPATRWKAIPILILALIPPGMVHWPQASSVMGFLAAAMVYLLMKPLAQLLSKDGTTIVNWAVYLVICLIFFVPDVVQTLFAKDLNAVWRWQLWMDEWQTIRQTHFLGIGFGAAYGSNTLSLNINNYAMFGVNAQGLEGLFVVAQHNSLMNVFYRLGLAGFLLGIHALVALPFLLGLKATMQAKGRLLLLSKWALLNFVFNLVIIVTNPGLESPRFMLGFFYSYCALVACILSVQDRVRAQAKIEGST
ncbi:MAG: hypothetical protein LBN04_08055 [Oscillospiraceae bacterium]|jgi:hypothetical protein|nr:hypothetical protein [Oscillospiraceae bacterium]